MSEREIIIRIKFPQRPRTRWLAGIAAGVLVVAVVTYASVPNTFSPGDSLSASKMNENFAALDARLTALEAGSNVPAGRIVNVAVTDFTSLLANTHVQNPSSDGSLVKVTVLSSAISYTPKFANSLLLLSANAEVDTTQTLNVTSRDDSGADLEILANSLPVGEGAVFQFGMQQTADINATVHVQGSTVVSSLAPIAFQLRLETDDNAGIYCPNATDNATGKCLFTVIEIRQ